MICVLDASVAVKWYLDEPGSDSARALRSVEVGLVAPQLLLVEAASVLWKYFRRGELEASIGSQILAHLEKAPIDLQEDALLYREAFALATDSGRTVYDCLYLSLALKKGCPFVTADRKLYNSLQGTYLASHLLWIDSIPQWMSSSAS